MGSGNLIKLALKKYGKENFSKEILAVFDNPFDMFSMEEKLVNEEFVRNQNTYNLKNGGGEDCWSHFENYSPELRSEWAKKGREVANINGANIKGSKKHLELLENDSKYREKYSKAIKEAIKIKGASFLGKNHTNETKQQMREAKLGKYDGEKNPNYGKCWIYSLTEQKSKSISKDNLQEYLDAGWTKGRKLKFD